MTSCECTIAKGTCILCDKAVESGGKRGERGNEEEEFRFHVKLDLSIYDYTYNLCLFGYYAGETCESHGLTWAVYPLLLLL